MDDEQIKISIEPFLVRKGDRDWRRAWYKYKYDISGSLTVKKENQWMVSQNAISINKDGQISVIIREGEKLSLYKILQDKLEEYKSNNNLKKIGSFIKI